MWLWLYGWNRKPNALERQLLDALQANSPPNIREQLSKQIEAIALVQRSPGNQESSCYARGKRDTALQFPYQDDEVKFATARFRHHGDSVEWQAQFIASGGHFFSIRFPRGPPILKRQEMVDIVDFHWLVDLSNSSQQPELRPADPAQVQLPPWVIGLMDEDGVTGMKASLDLEAREKQLARIEAALPADYLELCDRCEGFSSGDWSVLGLSEVYSISFPDLYYVLATLFGVEVLAVKAGEASGRVYLLEHEMDEPSGEFENLQVALEQLVRRED